MYVTFYNWVTLVTWTYRRHVFSLCLQCTVVLSTHACINTQKCVVVWPSVVEFEVKAGSGWISFLATHTGELSGLQKWRGTTVLPDTVQNTSHLCCQVSVVMANCICTVTMLRKISVRVSRQCRKGRDYVTAVINTAL